MPRKPKPLTEGETASQPRRRRAPARSAAATEAQTSEAGAPSATATDAGNRGETPTPPRALALSGRLLEAHLRFELAQWQGEALLQTLQRETRAFLDATETIPFNAFFSADSIMATIRRTVIDARIGGGITEIAGEMAVRVFQSAPHRETRLKEVLPPCHFKDWLDKLISLRSQRERIVSRLLEHPVYADLITQILQDALIQYLGRQDLLGNGYLNQGVSAMMKLGRKMVDKAAPGLEDTVEAGLRTFIRRNMGRFVAQSERFLNQSLDDETLRGMVLDFWDGVEDETLGALQQGIDPIDLNDFVVIGFEYWLRYRKTPHFTSACHTVVEGLFERHGNTPLGELLEELGITRALIETELLALLPALIAPLRENGYLEALLRRRLSAFYASADTQTLLRDSLVPDAAP